MTRTQNQLANMLQESAREEGCDQQSALRDLLTDLLYISEIYGLDFELAVDGAEEVFKDEQP